MEAGFKVVFRLPSEAVDDDVNLSIFPRYGGSVITPAGSIVYMEYNDHTWRLPLPNKAHHSHKTGVKTLNAFSSLADEQDILPTSPDKDNQAPIDKNDERNEKDQKRFELMCRRQQEAAELHNAGGHRNATDTVRDLKAAGVQIKHLQRYIHAHKCKYCEANLGRKSYKCHKVKQAGGEELLVSTIVDPRAPNTPITQTLSNELEITCEPTSNAHLRPLSHCNGSNWKISDSAQFTDRRFIRLLTSADRTN